MASSKFGSLRGLRPWLLIWSMPILGRPLEHLSHNLEAFDIATSLARTQQQQKPIAYDVKIKRGGPHLLMRVYPYINENKMINGAILTLVNVNTIQQTKERLAVAETQLRQSNEALEQQVQARTAELRKQQQLLQSITRATPNAIYIYDVRSRRNLYVNNYLEEMLGYSAEEIQAMGDTLNARIFHPDDLPRIVAHRQAIAQLQTVEGVDNWCDRNDRPIFDIEYRIRHVSGNWRYFYSKDIVFARDDDGQPSQILCMAVDISDRYCQ